MYCCRFGDGYTIKLRVEGQASDLNRVAMEMEQKFEGAYLKYQHRQIQVFQLPWTSSGLGMIFQFLEANKARMGVVDYSVSQTTLDEVCEN